METAKEKDNNLEEKIRLLSSKFFQTPLLDAKMLSDQISYAKLEPEKFYESKSRLLKMIKIFCFGVHAITIIVYVSCIVCFAFGDNANIPTASQPIIEIRTGFKTVDCICKR